ncbi:MAG: hypothetical protein A2746_02175 [Candidatus Yanofskybacteria bacterium RIFCSPHIGHO2_01_FULL_44_22]|uniref:Septum formation initiator n=1 Tax=Candidatus Yanofskybacteria bacterium RIFCSPHIGHO2_01_FULL_44_22 TaxID=1802669 RepID=A0A1F8EY13_9BACT|nr:MAG: hypothetical protein A2746_02175 [Candidatus Yanofskybacteria bacterium RIFCSPHIGHO2_01_FULL_44_22]
MNVFNSKIFFAVMIVAIGWLGLSFIGLRRERDVIKDEVAGLEAKINDAGQTNEELGKFIANFENPLFLEREAREKLNYKSEGEEVIFVHKSEGVKTASMSPENSETEPLQRIISKLSEYKNKFLKLFTN